MWQNKDIQYATFLENLWIGNILKSDFDLLNTHFLSNLNVNLFDLNIYINVRCWFFYFIFFTNQ
jgi:hypothetical protein